MPRNPYPYFKALIVVRMSAIAGGAMKRFAIICASAWVLISAFNLMFYEVSSGYSPLDDSRITGVQRAIWSGVQDAVIHQKTVYSAYSMGMLFHNDHNGSCEFDSDHREICLPNRIATGFPHRTSPLAAKPNGH
jgi:hypothetical protein